MTYVLHYAPDNAALIIRLALDHLSLPYTQTLVDRAQQGQRDPRYLTLNPNGLIPVLETPHGPIFETGAILLWLTDTHGSIGPAPDTPLRGDFLKWLFYVANTLHPALRMMFYADKYIGPDPAMQEGLRLGLEGQITTALAQLDRAASSGVFAADAPSAIDFYLAGCLRWCALYPSTRSRDWFVLADAPALARMCNWLEALPCTAMLQKAEGLGPTPFSAPTYANPPQGSAT